MRQSIYGQEEIGDRKVRELFKARILNKKIQDIRLYCEFVRKIKKTALTSLA